MKLLTIVLTATVLCISGKVAATCSNKNENMEVSTPTSAFFVEAGGVVRHNKTGLMWFRCNGDQTFSEHECVGTANFYNWSDALTYAAQSELNGYSNWRLPTRTEMQTIVEQQCSAPAVNTFIFPEISGYHWTSTPVAGVANNAVWMSDLGDGWSGAWNVDDNAKIILVRDVEDDLPNLAATE